MACADFHRQGWGRSQTGAMITSRYVMFIRIPAFADSDGRLYAGDLWARDVLRHLEYIQDFKLCCPLEPMENAPDDLAPLGPLTVKDLYPLRMDRGYMSVLANFTPNLRQVFRAAQPGGIMHSGGAGWAFPLSYYLLIARRFYRFRWLVLIESTMWMRPEDSRHSLRKRLGEAFHRRVISSCLRRADARIFTQSWYRDILLGETKATLIAPASWVDEAAVLPAPAARPTGVPRLLFATRMTAEKGVFTVLDAIARYPLDGPDLQIDFVGQGEESDKVDAAIAAHRGKIKVRRIARRAYGAPFYELLRDYDGVLIANRTEEQPRLIFDAFSQSIPCIASATNGNESLLDDGQTGWTFPVGDAAALCTLLEKAAADPDALFALRDATLTAARGHTHVQMHRNRAQFIKDLFGKEV